MTFQQDRRRKAFTLVEMLIVAALIALFAGLAVFSIETQYTLNRQKASIAECRQIATAMAFAQQDLGFFPKFCWLRHNVPNLLQRLQGLSFDAVEYHGLPVGDLQNRLIKQWKGQYLAFNQDKLVKMRFVSNGVQKTEDWLADPFRNPYVAYFIRTDPATVSGSQPTHRFLWNSGESANEFAGIVSYGRNQVPGLSDTADIAAINQRKGYRLYKETGDPVVFDMLNVSSNPASASNEYNVPAGRLNMILIDPLVPPVDTLGPRIREQGSDDRFVEF